METSRDEEEEFEISETNHANRGSNLLERNISML